MQDETPQPQQRILLVLFLGVLMAALDIAIVGPVLPAIQETFGLDERALAWVFNVFVLFNLVGVPLMSKLSDVLGRRAVYTADVILFGVGSLVVALSPSFVVMLIGRGMQGLAASGIFPVASAVVGDTFPPEKRGRTLGLLGAVFGIAFIIGPIMAGLLLQIGWSWLFLLNLPLALAIAVASVKVLPATRPDQKLKLDWGGLVTLGVLLAGLAYGVNRLDTERLFESFIEASVWPFFALTAVLLPLFIWVERRAPKPLLRLGLFKSRQVVLASLLAMGAGLTEAAFIFFPALAVAAFGVSKAEASFMLLPLVVAVAVGSPVAGRVLDRVGSRTIALTGTACLTVGLGLIGLYPGVRLWFYMGSIFIGFGLATLLGSALSYILLNESQAAERTVAQGVITLFISVGQMTGAALIGAVAASQEQDEVAGYGKAFLLFASIALVLLVLSFGLKRRDQEVPALTGLPNRP